MIDPSRRLVSVIIPCYNAASWIGEAIQSCLDQTYRPMEVIVIDDGSTDGSIDVIESFGEKVRWDRVSNRGGSAARNRGIALAAGQWIQFLDADDFMSPGKIEEQVQILMNAPVGCLAVCGTTYFQDGQSLVKGIDSPGYEALNSDDPLSWLTELWTPGEGYGTTRWGMVPLHAWLVPRAIVDAAGPWTEGLRIDQDGEYFCRVVLASSGIRWSPNSRVFYRKYTDRASTSTPDRRKLTSAVRSVDLKAQAIGNHLGGPWPNRTRQAIARQYKNIAFTAVPFALSIARTANRRAKEYGDYDANSFLAYNRLALRLSKLLGWPLTRCIMSLWRQVRPR